MRKPSPPSAAAKSAVSAPSDGADVDAAGVEGLPSGAANDIADLHERVFAKLPEKSFTR